MYKVLVRVNFMAKDKCYGLHFSEDKWKVVNDIISMGNNFHHTGRVADAFIEHFARYNENG